jgi:fengycin family lipopeptide synthetase D
MIPPPIRYLESRRVYVPIDVNLPIERIETIIKDSQIKTLITRGKHLNALIPSSVEIVDLDKTMTSIEGHQPLGVPVKVGNNDLAYGFTSGSTGNPKGVMIEPLVVEYRSKYG